MRILSKKNRKNSGPMPEGDKSGETKKKETMIKIERKEGEEELAYISFSVFLLLLNTLLNSVP